MSQNQSSKISPAIFVIHLAAHHYFHLPKLKSLTFLKQLEWILKQQSILFATLGTSLSFTSI